MHVSGVFGKPHTCILSIKKTLTANWINLGSVLQKVTAQVEVQFTNNRWNNTKLNMGMTNLGMTKVYHVIFNVNISHVVSRLLTILT